MIWLVAVLEEETSVDEMSGVAMAMADVVWDELLGGSIDVMEVEVNMAVLVSTEVIWTKLLLCSIVVNVVSNVDVTEDTTTDVEVGGGGDVVVVDVLE